MKRFIAWFVAIAALLVAGVNAGFRGRAERTFAVRIAGGTRTAADESRRLAAALRMLELRDSVARALRARPALPSLSVTLPGSLPATVREEVTTGLLNLWRAVAGDAARTPTVFLVVTPDRNDRPSIADAVTLTPEATASNACVVVLARTDMTEYRRWAHTDSSWRGYRSADVANVCAWYARHGLPGRGIQRWLASEAWQAASAAPPLTVLRNPEASQPPRSREQPRTTTRFAFTDWRYYSPAEWFTPGSNPVFNDFREAACLSGDTASCEDALRSARPLRTSHRMPLLPASMVALPGWWFGANSWHRGIMANIERSLGPAKFAQFWRSEAEPEAALAELYPGGAAAVVRDRLLDSRYPLVASPWPTAAEWLVAILIAATATAAMLVMNWRRSLAT